MVSIITGKRVYEARITEQDNMYCVHITTDDGKTKVAATRFKLDSIFEIDCMPWIKERSRQHSENN